MANPPRVEDRSVLTLKLNTVNRYIEHFEAMISKMEVGTEKVVLLGEDESDALVNDFCCVLAEAWQGPPPSSLISKDLARVEQGLGEGYAAERAGFVDRVVAERDRLERMTREGGPDQERIESAIVYVVVAASLYRFALIPAGCLRDEVIEALNRETPIVTTTDHATVGCEEEPRAKVLRTRTEEDRDKWIYERACETALYKDIANELKRKAKETRWAAIESVQGIRKAAQTYAERNGLPPPPPRQAKRTNDLACR
jgi:hypothetical protein